MSMTTIEPKRKRIIYLLIFGLVIYAFIFLLPTMVGRDLQPGSSVNNEHVWTSKSYRLDVKEGEQYTFTLSTDPFWGMDMSIALYSSPLKVAGVKSDEISSSSEQITFTAKHSGRYYVTVSGKGSGFYDVSFDETGSASIEASSHVNLLKIGLLLLPAIFIYVIYRGINKISTWRKSIRHKTPTSPMSTKAYDTSPSQSNARVNQVCEYCGIEFTGYKEKCPNCGAYLKSK